MVHHYDGKYYKTIKKIKQKLETKDVWAFHVRISFKKLKMH
jgi:hypothetical protein